MSEDLILFASRGTDAPLFYNRSKNKNPPSIIFTYVTLRKI